MIWKAIIRALAFLVGILLGGSSIRRAGADAALQKVKDEDRAKADAIRDHADVARRVQHFDPDTRGYRD